MNVIKRQQRPFIDRKAVGRYGEDIVINFLKDNKYMFKDVRNVGAYQKIEIDFITYINNKKQSIEVKASENNIYRYNSIMVKLFTEYDSLEEKQKRGNDAYMFRTKATYLFYVCCVTNEIIIVKTKTLKDYINANLHNLNIRIYQDDEKDASLSQYNRKNTVAYIPINELPKNGIKRIRTNYKLSLNNYVPSSAKRQ